MKTSRSTMPTRGAVWPRNAKCAVMLIRFIKRYRNIWWATGAQVAEHWIANAGR